MHDDRELTEARLRRVLDQRIRPAVYPDSVPMEVGAGVSPGEPVPVADGLAAVHEPVAVGARWGSAASDTTWFEVRGRVPPRWAGEGAGLADTTVELLLHDGADHCGLTVEATELAAPDVESVSSAFPFLVGTPTARYDRQAGLGGTAGRPWSRLVQRVAVRHLCRDGHGAGRARRGLGSPPAVLSSPPRTWSGECGPGASRSRTATCTRM